jgi:hypothetical protein
VTQLFDLNAIEKYSTSLSTIVLVVLTTANLFFLGGGSVISAGTIHDLRRLKVPAHFETPERRFLEIDQPETRIAYVSHVI